jgi:hypothetical protein
VISCADKLNNIQAMVRDYEQVGDKLWERFNEGKEQQKWYYQGLVESLCGNIQDEKTAFIFEKFQDNVSYLFGDNTFE